jgi:class 3 adenylate cyclase
MPLNLVELLAAVTLSAACGAAIGFANSPSLAGAWSPRRRRAPRAAAHAARRASLAAAGLPRGTLTLLFTDIEGSTRLLQRQPERYGDLLVQHQHLLREAFAAHGGREVSTQGDGFFVVFRCARDAVAGAVDAQRAMAAYDWPAGDEPRVRMGLHTDEPTIAADTYVGLGVHRAARICAAGHGGQILVSDATREHLWDRPSDGTVLADLGDHWLKDLDRPERVHQVLAPGLPDAFPRLKAIASAGAARRPRTVGAQRARNRGPVAAPVGAAESWAHARAFGRRPYGPGGRSIGATYQSARVAGLSS